MTEIGWASVGSATSVALRTNTYFWGDVIILRCVGHLVAGKETTAFRQGIEKLLSQGFRVVINLTEVDLIDSKDLASFVHLLTQKGEPESGARLVSSRKRWTELLQRTKLDTVIRVYASEEDAIASFTKKRSPSPDSQA
jgi:anti-anti-sigma factor